LRIHRDEESRDHRERLVSEFSRRLAMEGTPH
jgi:hypothetical protein